MIVLNKKTIIKAVTIPTMVLFAAVGYSACTNYQCFCRDKNNPPKNNAGVEDFVISWSAKADNIGDAALECRDSCSNNYSIYFKSSAVECPKPPQTSPTTSPTPLNAIPPKVTPKKKSPH